MNRRFGKGLSLGQTVERLKAMASAGYDDRLITGYRMEAVEAALYHIEKLRGKLHRLNLKIARDALKEKQ